MGRKISTGIVAVIFALTMFVGQALAATFTDVKGHWAEGTINEWAQKGLAGGYSDGTFQPNKQVSRAEFVAMVNRVFNIANNNGKCDFSDVKDGQWFYSEVCAAKAYGYIGGYADGTFKPNQTITRQEAASILVRLLGIPSSEDSVKQFADAGQIQTWARGAVGAAASNNIMSGFPDQTFRPLQGITRAEAVVSLSRAKEPKGESGITGTVTAEGKTVSDAVVRVFAADDLKVIQETKTGANGEFKLNVAPGKYDITVVTDSKVGYVSDVAVAAKNNKDVKVTLEKAAILSGSVEDANGKSVKNTTFLLTTNPTFIAKTDKNGKYTVAVLPNRDYTVRVYNPDEKDKEPVAVPDKLEIGPAGKHLLTTIKAPFELKGGLSGGGGGGPTTPTVDVINQPGTHTGNYTVTKSGTYGPASGTSTIVGTLTIDPGSNGEVLLQNIDVDNVIVSSGASNSIRLKGVKVKQALKINARNQNNSVRIVTQDSSITVTQVESKVILEAAQGGSFGDVTIASAAAGDQVELKGTFSGNITIAPGVQGLKLDIAEGTTLANLSGNVQGIETITVADGVEVPPVNPELVQLAADLATVRNVKAALEITFANGDTNTTVTKNLGLTVTDPNANITWVSSNTDVITNNGTVLRPRVGNKTVTLTASIKKGQAAVTKSFTVTVKGIADELVPLEPTLEALLNAIQAGLNSLSQEEWNNLKAQRDQLVNDLTEQEIFDALKKAGFENITNTNITIEQARFALATIRGLSHLGRDNVSDSVQRISQEITKLKSEFSEVVTKLRQYNINQRVVYQYGIDLHSYILTAGNLSESNYEEDLYDAALAVLRDGQHPELERMAKTTFDRLKAQFSEESTIGKLIKPLEFGDVDGELIILAKTALGDNNSEYDSLFDTLDFMVNLSKTFLPLN